MRHCPPQHGALALAALPVLAATAGAQNEGDRERARADRERARTRVFVRDDDSERPVIGVNTASSGERDTLGLLVVSVTPGGPADQAGIEEGNRIAAVNGTNLRLSAADAGERDMQGMTTRRLVRELGKVEPGAEVTLRVWQNGSYRDVRVKTVAAEDLPGRRRASREERENRGVIGLRLGGGASRRDTLGILVVGLTPDGPAEKAGIVEGDRIQAIGDVDLRVPAADAGDHWMTNTRVNRFMREMREVKPGQSVTLRVRSGGQVRTVNITAVAAKDLEDEGSVFFYGDNIGFEGVMPAPAIAPMPPMPPMIEMAPVRPRTPRAVRVPRVEGTTILDLDGVDAFEALGGLETFGALEALEAMNLDGLEGLEGLEALEGIDYPDVDVFLAPHVWQMDAEPGDEARRADEAKAALDRAREALEAREREVREREVRVRAAERGPLRSAAFSWDDGAAPTLATAAAEPARSANTISLPGLTLSLVNRDLADYFGAGAERGLLVLAADRRWDGLREGDVILTVDGKGTAGFACVSALRKGERGLEVLRDGKRVKMTVNGTI